MRKMHYNRLPTSLSLKLVNNHPLVKGKTMKIKVGLLKDSMPALTEFANIEMNPAMAMKVRKVLKVARKEMETVQEVEQEVAAKHKAVSKTAPNGVGYYDFGTVEAKKAYEEELKPSRENEVELPDVGLTKEDLESLTKVKPAVLDALEWLFVNIN